MSQRHYRLRWEQKAQDIPNSGSLIHFAAQPFLTNLNLMSFAKLSGIGIGCNIFRLHSYLKNTI